MDDVRPGDDFKRKTGAGRLSQHSGAGRLIHEDLTFLLPSVLVCVNYTPGGLQKTAYKLAPLLWGFFFSIKNRVVS